MENIYYKKAIEEAYSWIAASNNNLDNEYIKEYLTGGLLLMQIKYIPELFDDVGEALKCSEGICDILQHKSIDIFNNQLEAIQEKISVNARNIPQYSSLIDGTEKITGILLSSGNTGLSFDELGQYLTYPGKSDVAYKKYGENHSKLAALLGLAIIDQRNPKSLVYATVFGKVFKNFKPNDRERLLVRLIYRIPVIQKIVLAAKTGKTTISEHLSVLSPTTQQRRRPNVANLINFINKYSEEEMKELMGRIEMR
jgi:hypothetical protein